MSKTEDRHRPSRRIRIYEETCEAIEAHMKTIHWGHSDISPFVEWVLRAYLSGDLPIDKLLGGPARKVTVERVEHEHKRKQTA